MSKLDWSFKIKKKPFIIKESRLEAYKPLDPNYKFIIRTK